jgi:TRAP-type C4-dicarboxylate transport system substrate-binding protein
LPRTWAAVRQAALDALDPGAKQALVKAARKAEACGWAISQKKNAESLELLKAKGMAVAAPSAQLSADLQKIGQAMLEEWLAKAGADGQAVVEAYLSNT